MDLIGALIDEVAWLLCHGLWSHRTEGEREREAGRVFVLSPAFLMKA